MELNVYLNNMKKLILILLIPLGLFGQGKISEMPAASTVTGTELMEVVQGGVNKKITLSQTGSTFYVPLARTLTINGTSYTLDTNRSWSVGNVFTSGTYSNPSWITSFAATKITGTLLETQGGTGFNSYTTGDLLYASAPTTLQKLGIGTNGYALISNGTTPSWQPISSTLAALTDVSLSGLASGDFLKYNGSAWINRTSAQVLSDIGAQASLVSGTNIKTVNSSSLLGSGNLAVGDALVANPLSQFASTTSSQLAGIISDETGTAGNLVFSTSPTLVTPTLGIASSTSESIIGTGGNGFLEIANQSSAPSTPTSAGRIYFNNSNALSWIGTNGFTRTIDGTANTANRSYAIPDFSGNVLVSGGVNTLTGTTTNFTGSSSSRFVFDAASLGANSLVTITNTATDAASNSQRSLLVSASGANSTSSQTTYGGHFQNVKTGTSSTNVGIYATATSGTTNHAAYFKGNTRLESSVSSAGIDITGGSITNFGGTNVSMAITGGDLTLNSNQTTNLTNTGNGSATVNIGNTITTKSAAASLITTTGGWSQVSSGGTSAIIHISNAFTQTVGNPSASLNYRMISMVPSYTETSATVGGYVAGIYYSPSVSLSHLNHYAAVFGSGSVGIGTLTPTYKLQVKGNGTTTGNLIRFEDSGATARLTMLDNGETSLGGTLTIASTVSTPDASARLQVNSTTKGFLPPRMTGTQAEAISSPAEGLMVYSTDGSGATITSKGWWGYDGSTWIKLN